MVTQEWDEWVQYHTPLSWVMLFLGVTCFKSDFNSLVNVKTLSMRFLIIILTIFSSSLLKIYIHHYEYNELIASRLKPEFNYCWFGSTV